MPRVCQHEECRKSPAFNYAGLPGAYCKAHQLGGMVNTRKSGRRICENADCGKIPMFNIPGERSGRFCKDHKTVDMIDVRRNP